MKRISNPYLTREEIVQRMVTGYLIPDVCWVDDDYETYSDPLHPDFDEQRVKRENKRLTYL